MTSLSGVDTTSTSILPKDHSEFRTQQYWNDFFIKRQATTSIDDGTVESTFEWYGDWSDISSLVSAYVPPSNGEVLVIGCGNSTTSEEMFEQGYTRMTSIDFSDIVIKEMNNKLKTKELNSVNVDDSSSAWLNYEKMDFLNMTYSSNKFRLVFDKGALDALMSDDTLRSKKDAATLFQEIDRVIEAGLDNSGSGFSSSDKKIAAAYVCVTLAQKHILSALFRHFARPGSMWDIHVHTFSPKLGSALCPFAFVAVRRDQPHAAGAMPAIMTHFGNLTGGGTSTGDNEKKESSSSSSSANATEDGTSCNMGDAIRNIVAMQQTHNFLGGPVKPGCAITLHLWPQHGEDDGGGDGGDGGDDGDDGDDGGDGDGGGGGGSGEGGGETKTTAAVEKDTSHGNSSSTTPKTAGPRFTVTVLDADDHVPTNGSYSCGVFIVPRGREVEFLFNTTEGQMDLARQASFARFIIVAMERGHDFSGGLEQVKLELDPYMSKLSPPTPVNQSPYQIPYLTTGTDSLGHRVEMHRGKSMYSGEYAVEEVMTDEEEGTIVRRLIFLDNSNLV